ncbi:MAG: hypothetical protein AAGJ73_12180 [Pseudomonadota bacterium]
MKKTLLLAAAAALTLSGCVTPSELNRFELEVSQQVCNVDALAEEKQTTLTTSNDLKYSLAPYQNKHGTYDEETSTILMQKLFKYDAEVEASYRFVTQSCGAYMRCLERNKHDERLCKRTEGLWNKSQNRFANLSIILSEIEADVEIFRLKAHKKRKHRRHHYETRPCCDTINNIFTDCCG